MSKNASAKNKKVSLVFIILGAACIIFAIIMLVRTFMDYQSSINFYKNMNADYVNDTENTAIGQQVPDDAWASECIVDFDSLWEINPDVVGWIYFENEDISYPILYSGDDDTYIHMTMDGVTCTAGSIFLEGQNSPDFEDSHTIIYGHNMRNRTMFGRLKFYKNDEEYYDSHQYFQIITKEASYRYQIFAYNDTDADSDVYVVPYSAEDPEFTDFIASLFSASYLDSDIDVTNDDKIITLSTCSYSDSKRFVVHGVRVATYNWETSQDAESE